jgi:hypothetical protein
MDSRLLLESLTRLKATWPSPPWSWDSRFATVAASFTIDLEPAVRQSAQLAERTGLRSNQRLLGGDEVFAPRLFGLWWPWGGGDKVTLRIGVIDVDAATEPVPSIRALFDVV